MKREPAYRRPLNTGQLGVLRILYVFRFSTAELLAKYFKKDTKKHIQKRLQILEAQGYIAKRYDGSYKLQGKPAAYFSTPKGIRQYSSTQGETFRLPDHVLPAAYKNPAVSESFMERCFQAFEVFLWLKAAYGEGIKYYPLFTLDKNTTEDLPHPLPQARLVLHQSDMNQNFLLEICDATTPFFVYVRRIKKYLELADSGELEDFCGNEMPRIVMVCETAGLQRRMHKRIRSELRRTETYEDLEFVTTSLEALRQADQGPAAVWQSSEEADEYFTLEEL